MIRKFINDSEVTTIETVSTYRSLEIESVLHRYEEEAEGEGEVSGISISVCVNTSGEEQPGVPPQSSALLTVNDRRLPHQR